jgi:hypothetical protein
VFHYPRLYPSELIPPPPMLHPLSYHPEIVSMHPNCHAKKVIINMWNETRESTEGSQFRVCVGNKGCCCTQVLVRVHTYEDVCVRACVGVGVHACMARLARACAHPKNWLMQWLRSSPAAGMPIICQPLTVPPRNPHGSMCMYKRRCRWKGAGKGVRESEGRALQHVTG